MKRKALRICYLVLECLLEPHIRIDSHVTSLSPFTDCKVKCKGSVKF